MKNALISARNMNMQVILLEKIAHLGNMGDVVKVRDGFGRNFLIPQNKALRATDANKKEFEQRKGEIMARNEASRKEAEIAAKKLEGVSVTLVRQASEDGKLYGSVTVRDVAQGLEDAGHKVDRKAIQLHTTLKTTGAYTVQLALHPEVHVNITLAVVRNESEAGQAIEELLKGDEPAEAAPAQEAKEAAEPEEKEGDAA
jgi:large subunit ribosomal protein L9